MPIERPPPLNLKSLLSPKDALKQMLEATNNRDNGIPSPLDEIDPMSLDELINRIDSGYLALDQIPDPKDIDKLVQYYWSLRDKFNLEIQTGIKDRPKGRKRVANSEKIVVDSGGPVPQMLFDDE